MNRKSNQKPAEATLICKASHKMFSEIGENSGGDATTNVNAAGWNTFKRKIRRFPAVECGV
jgi:hypothetical protein